MKLKTLFTVAVAAILVSCTNEAQQLEQRLQGSWKLTYVKMYGTTYIFNTTPESFVLWDTAISEESFLDISEGIVNFDLKYGVVCQTPYQLFWAPVRDSLLSGSYQAVELASHSVHNDSLYMTNHNRTSRYHIWNLTNTEMVLWSEQLIYCGPQLGWLQGLQELRFTKQ